MSTRANIIMKDGNRSLIFYRHSDGYPEGVLPSLKKLVDLMASGPLRDNLSQASGWLIVLGALEYAALPKVLVADKDGSEHLYVVDMERKAIDEIEIPGDHEKWQNQKVIQTHYAAEVKKVD